MPDAFPKNPADFGRRAVRPFSYVQGFNERQSAGCNVPGVNYINMTRTMALHSGMDHPFTCALYLNAFTRLDYLCCGC
jgi:hypothetical protein